MPDQSGRVQSDHADLLRQSHDARECGCPDEIGCVCRCWQHVELRRITEARHG